MTDWGVGAAGKHGAFQTNPEYASLLGEHVEDCSERGTSVKGKPFRAITFWVPSVKSTECSVRILHLQLLVPL